MTTTRTPSPSLSRAAGGEHDVLALEVAVDHARAVGGADRRRHRPHDRQRRRRRERALVAQALREADAGDQLHGDEQDARTGALGAAVVNAEVEDAADVGVGDPAGQIHLLFQAARGQRVVGDRRGDRLDRDVRAQHLVLGLVHLAHAAAGDEANDAVPPGQLVAGREPGDHRVRRPIDARGRARGTRAPPRRSPPARQAAVRVLVDARDVRPRRAVPARNPAPRSRRCRGSLRRPGAPRGEVIAKAPGRSFRFVLVRDGSLARPRSGARLT